MQLKKQMTENEKKKVGFNPVILLLFEKSIQVLERKAHLGGEEAKCRETGLKIEYCFQATFQKFIVP